MRTMRVASAWKASGTSTDFAMISSIAFCVCSCSISASDAWWVCSCSRIRPAIDPIRRVARTARISTTIQAEDLDQHKRASGNGPAAIQAAASTIPKARTRAQMNQIGVRRFRRVIASRDGGWSGNR